MTAQPTDDQLLKLFLAGCLNGKISATEYVYFGSDGSFINHGIRWTGGWEKIKDTEWPHICQLVEQSLTNDQHVYFRLNLRQITESRVKTYSENLRAYVSSGWQQRAMALGKVLKV